MSMVKKIVFDIARGALIAVSPKIFNLLYYRLKLNRKCDLAAPTAFSEKTMWLKLYWRDPRAVVYADKYEVRQYIIDRGYGDLLIRMLGVYDSVEDIEFDKLPRHFVLKATHSSGMNFICRDKSIVDWNAQKKELRHWLKCNYYYQCAEFHYNDMKPRIICEELLEDVFQTQSLTDYKFMCFDGEPRFVMVYADRTKDSGISYCFDADWNLMPVHSGKFNKSDKKITRPGQLEYMLQVARDFSAGFPFIRVDLYIVNDKVYFGELTFFHNAGVCKFSPPEYDEIFGGYLTLPEKAVKP